MSKIADRITFEGETVMLVEHRLRSVLDSIAPYTVGVEEEYVLVDPETLAPAPVAASVLETLNGDRRLVCELQRCQVEAVSPISVTVADIVRELSGARNLLGACATGTALPVAVGVHPLAREMGPVTDAPRYDLVASAHPLAARRTLACGLHVHVAVSGAERALAVYNALRSYLPLLGAVAANAPFFEGTDSQMASVRPTLLRHLSRTGIPPAFDSIGAYADFLVWSRSAGAHDATHHWWDLRLHPYTGTIEVRVADVPTCIEDTGALTALIQTLAFWLAARDEGGEQLEFDPTERIEANARLAARYGVNARLASCIDGSTARVS